MNVKSNDPLTDSSSLSQTESAIPRRNGAISENKFSLNKKLIFLIIIGLFLIGLVPIGFSIRSIRIKTPKPDAGVSKIGQEPTENIIKIVTPIGEELFYQKGKEVWYLDQTGKSTQITNTNQGIYGFEQTADGSVVAFITGDKTSTDNSAYEDVTPNAVYVYLAGSGQTEKIYELAPITFPNSSYAVTIRGVGVSNDGSKIAITTSDSLLVYDISSGTLETIFSFPVKNPMQIEGVRWYANPLFSPDNTKIVFMKGYIEGFAMGLVDLVSKDVQDLPYWGYIDGQQVLGWADNLSLIINEYETNSGKLKIDKLSEPGESSILFETEGSPRAFYISSNIIYALVDRERPNYDVHDSLENPDYESYTDIYEFDLQNKVKRVLYSLRVESVDVGELYELKLSANGKKLYISGRTGIITDPPRMPDEYTPVIVLLDLKKGGDPVIILQDASF